MITNREIVIASNEFIKRVHQDLFHISEECYIIIDPSILWESSVISRYINGDIERVHFVLNWTDIMKVCTWCERPVKGDILLLLKRVGLSDKELQPFRDSLDDILTYLYYGNRFDILRRLCTEAKRKIEKNLKGSAIYYCHLVYEETSSIIASSL